MQKFHVFFLGNIAGKPWNLKTSGGTLSLEDSHPENGGVSNGPEHPEDTQ